MKITAPESQLEFIIGILVARKGKESQVNFDIVIKDENDFRRIWP